MSHRQLKENIHSVGAVDWDRRLFDELIPLPGGTSYNSYFISGSRANALIDTVEEEFADDLLRNLNELEFETLDYVISNHSEPDHSSALPEILRAYPEAELLTGAKGEEMLEKLLHLDTDRITTVEDGEELSLGNRTLKFVETPWVHWPETISTYLKEDGILFSCDFFGSHLADSNPYAEDREEVYRAAKRYYAQIMMPFRHIITKNLDKVRELEPEIIAPSHGPIYKNPDFILDAYDLWVNGGVKKEVVVPYISMHGSTEELVDHFIDRLMQKEITVKPFNLREVELGRLAMSLVEAAVIVVGSPTVLGGPHPEVIYAVTLANALKPKTEFASVIGSCGWGGNLVDGIVDNLDRLDVEIFDPVLSMGKGREEDFSEVERLVADIEDAFASM